MRGRAAPLAQPKVVQATRNAGKAAAPSMPPQHNGLSQGDPWRTCLQQRRAQRSLSPSANGRGGLIFTSAASAAANLKGGRRMAVVETERRGQVLVLRMKRPARPNEPNSAVRTTPAEILAD